MKRAEVLDRTRRRRVRSAWLSTRGRAISVGVTDQILATSFGSAISNARPGTSTDSAATSQIRTTMCGRHGCPAFRDVA